MNTNQIQSRDIHFGVVGLGYVGLPLAVDFAQAGFRVTGIDTDTGKVDKINSGHNYIEDVSDSHLSDLVEQSQLRATTDFSVVEEIDALSICVPTPLNKLKDPDVSYILGALDSLVAYLHPGMLLVLESTTYPGTTRELILPRLEETGMQVGEDFYLAFSPERVDPGNREYQTRNTPKVMGGITPQCLEIGKALYEEVIDTVVPVSSTEAAELVKLLENTFRSINIGLVNEMAIMAEKLGVDIWEVIEAAGTKPFGYMKFYPGPGLGGHCIPIDPYYLAWKMKTLNYRARFIEMAGEINTEMPNHVVQLVMEGLNKYQKSLNGSNIMVVGVAYKRDTDDVRESPALDIIKLLQEKGARIDYYDPHVPELKINGTTMSSMEYAMDFLSEYDAVVVVTDHSDIPYEKIIENASLIIDTRNAIRTNGRTDLASRVLKLGNGSVTINQGDPKPDDQPVVSTNM